jgi:hypothetical protein
MKYPPFISFPHLVGHPIAEARMRANATEATPLSGHHHQTPPWTREGPSRPCSYRTSTTSLNDPVTHKTEPYRHRRDDAELAISQAPWYMWYIRKRAHAR